MSMEGSCGGFCEERRRSFVIIDVRTAIRCRLLDMATVQHHETTRCSADPVFAGCSSSGLRAWYESFTTLELNEVKSVSDDR